MSYCSITYWNLLSLLSFWNSCCFSWWYPTGPLNFHILRSDNHNGFIFKFTDSYTSSNMLLNLLVKFLGYFHINYKIFYALLILIFLLTIGETLFLCLMSWFISAVIVQIPEVRLFWKNRNLFVRVLYPEKIRALIRSVSHGVCFLLLRGGPLVTSYKREEHCVLTQGRGWKSKGNLLQPQLLLWGCKAHLWW